MLQNICRGVRSGGRSAEGRQFGGAKNERKTSGERAENDFKICFFG